MWTGAGKAGRLLGRGAGALLSSLRRRQRATQDDGFDPSKPYEIGIDGEVIDGQHTDTELGEIAKRARKEAAKRARQIAKKRAKDAKAGPQWPNVDVDEVAPPPPPPPPDAWPDYDVDAYAPESERHPPTEPKRSLPAEQDHAPPPSSPSHRGKPREKPRITSTNTGGKTMSVSPMKYNDLVTNANTRRQGWQDAADAFRRDADDFDEKAKGHDEAARIFKGAGNLAAAEEREHEARKLRDDANTCRTYASKMQEKANAEASAA